VGPIGLGETFEGRIRLVVQKLVDRPRVDRSAVPQALEFGVRVNLVDPGGAFASPAQVEQISYARSIQIDDVLAHGAPSRATTDSNLRPRRWMLLPVRANCYGTLTRLPQMGWPLAGTGTKFFPTIWTKYPHCVGGSIPSVPKPVKVTGLLKRPPASYELTPRS